MTVENFWSVGIGIPVRFVLSTMSGVCDPDFGALLVFEREFGGP